MKIIESVKEINYHYYGVDLYNYSTGKHYTKIKDIFIKPRKEETTQIYLLHQILLKDRVQLKSQMFYMSTNPESRFDHFFYNLGMKRNRQEGYAFDDLIGQTGVVYIENEISYGTEYSNIVSFMPMKKEEWEQELKVVYGGKQ